MKLNLKATGIELTPSLSEYVTKRISSLEKYVGTDREVLAQVEVGRTTEHHKQGDVYKAEVHLIGSGLNLFALSEKDDIYAAIDAVKDEIAHELNKLKGKRFAMARRGGQAAKNMMKGIWSSAARVSRFRFRRKR